jgi:hypothetical protein
MDKVAADLKLTSHHNEVLKLTDWSHTFTLPCAFMACKKTTLFSCTFINVFKLPVCVEESLTDLLHAGIAESALVCSVTSLMRFF